MKSGRFSEPIITRAAGHYVDRMNFLKTLIGSKRARINRFQYLQSDP